MAFPKFHGINIALNAWIENCQVERVASDPVPIQAGRMWFNTTAKALKYSTLDSGGAVVVATVASGESLASVIADLAALGADVSAIEADYVKKDGSVAFTGNINAGGNKVTNAANAVASSDLITLGQVDAKIAAIGNAFDYVGLASGGASSGAALDMSTLSNTDAGSYYKVDVAGYFKADSVATPFYANIGDGLVFNTTAGVDKIDNTDSTVAGTTNFIAVTGSTDTGFTVDIDAAFKTRVSDAEAAITAETARATAAEGVIASDLADEVARATSAEGVLTTAVSNEVTARTDADTALTTAISNEVSRATAAEGVIASDLADEIARATAAEDELSTRVGPLSSLATIDKADIVSAINEVKAAAGGGTADLQARINNQKFTYESVAPALTHTLDHNMDTEFAMVTAWVRGDDTIYRNDIVSIEETDNNTITITLTESRHVKAMVQNMNNLVEPT